jgi:hypothetical protein
MPTEHDVAMQVLIDALRLFGTGHPHRLSPGQAMAAAAILEKWEADLLRLCGPKCPHDGARNVATLSGPRATLGLMERLR